MPDISLPEVRFRARLPEGLRDMSVEDIQHAMPDVRLPKVDLSKVELPKLDVDFGREASRAAKRADKAAKSARKSAVRAVENALPRKPGPNPVPVAILAMLGGVVVGWLLATNPVTGPKVRAWLDSVRRSLFERSSGSGEDEWDTTDAQAYPASLRAEPEPERYTGLIGEESTATGTEPEPLPAGLGTADPADVGATDPDAISSTNGTTRVTSA
jgi:hypothetical protein